MELGSFCLIENYKKITLQPKSLSITGIQKGFIQNLEIYQSIESEEDLNEVSYIFPTDNHLCIYSMKFQIGIETINAELMKKEEAEQTFKEAKKIGYTSAKAESISPGITEIKIGNIPKGKVVAVIFKCSFTSILQNPTTIFTKIPLQASEPDGMTIDLYNLPSIDINLDLTISQLQPISDVYTNCKSNYEKIDDYNGRLTIKSSIITDENILIMTEFSQPVQSQMIHANNTTLISIIPEFEPVKNNLNEYVFLIDCSASMLGKSIQKAKESLHLFLSKIPENSYFNIFCFGTKYVKLFDHSSQKVELTIERAKDFIDKIRANLGGTEMLLMLSELFNDEVKIGCQRQIFIITDGEVYQRQKVVSKISENRCHNRIFAIGLGHGADAGFLDEITEMTNGKSDFVFNKDELPAKVVELLDLSMIEAASDVEIHVDGNDSFEAVPYPLNPLLPGVVTHFVVYSKFKIENVMVSGKIMKNGEEIDNVIELSTTWPFVKPEKSPVFALFAWNQLKRLADNEERSVQLSIASGVMCSYTSYIAVFDTILVERTNEIEIEYNEEGGRIHRRKRGKPKEEVDSISDCTKRRRHTHKLEKHDDAHERIEACADEKIKEEVEEIMEVESGRRHRRMRETSPVDPEEGSFLFGHPRRRRHMNKTEKTCDTHETEKTDDVHETDIIDTCTESVTYKEKPPESHRNESVKAYNDDYDDGDYDYGDGNGNGNDDDDGDNENLPKINVQEIDPSKVWKDDASVDEIIRFQSCDGFWDLPMIYISIKCKGKLPEISNLDLSESPIVKKRVISTVFTLAYLMKFYNENKGQWRFSKEKGLKWLKRIGSMINWEQIIEGIILDVQK